MPHPPLTTSDTSVSIQKSFAFHSSPLPGKEPALSVISSAAGDSVVYCFTPWDKAGGHSGGESCRPESGQRGGCWDLSQGQAQLPQAASAKLAFWL